MQRLKGFALGAALALLPMTVAAPTAEAVVVGVHIGVPGHHCWDGRCYRYMWHGGYYNYYWHGHYWRYRFRCHHGWCYR